MAPDPDPVDDAGAMTMALEEARVAGERGEVPVGAVVVLDGTIIARRGNEREATGDPTAHAEILALRDAATATGDRRMRAATLVVTLEPCPMCAGAVWAAQVGRVVYGAPDRRAGAVGSLYNIAVDQRLNHVTEVRSGLQADQAAALLTDFFAERR